MKPTYKKLLSFSVLIVLVVLLARYVMSNIDSFSQVSFVNPGLFFFLLLILLVSYIPVSVNTYALLLPLGVRLQKMESFFLSIVTGFYNLFTPFRGGMAIRAMYLKKKHKLSYTRFLSSLAASYVLAFFVAAIMGLIGLALIYYETGVLSVYFLVLFSSLFVGLLLLIVFSPRLPQTRFSFINRFIDIANGWHLIRKDRGVVVTIALMCFAQLVCITLSMYLQFAVFGEYISVGSAVFLAVMSALSIIIGLTPAGLGITEAIVVFSASTLGISPVTSLSAALVGRLVSVVVLFILGPLFSVTLLKNVRGDHGTK